MKSDQLIEKSVSKNDIMKQIGWSPKYNIKTGIKKIIEYEKRIFKQDLKKSKNRILITCFGIKKITWLNHILEAGISVSLNSDDPPFFNTSVGKEYQNGAEHFNLDLKQLLYISRMAMESSFADTKTKDLLVKQINEWSID